MLLNEFHQTIVEKYADESFFYWVPLYFDHAISTFSLVSDDLNYVMMLCYVVFICNDEVSGSSCLFLSS